MGVDPDVWSHSAVVEHLVEYLCYRVVAHRDDIHLGVERQVLQVVDGLASHLAGELLGMGERAAVYLHQLALVLECQGDASGNIARAYYHYTLFH